MPVQTTAENYKAPDGLRFDISTDGGSSWEDIGAMGDGVEFTYNYTKTEVEFGNAANPDPLAKNQQLAMTPSDLYTFKSSALGKVGAGLFTVTAVAGTLVSGAEQIVTSGNWAFDEGIELDGQNANGTAPTINSVTGSVDGAGAADDYTTVLVDGKWRLVPLDGTNFITEDQDLTIDYDYTPAAMYETTAGTTTKVLVPYQCRFTHYTDSSMTTYDWRMTVYRVTPDSGGITISKKGAIGDNTYDTWTLAITGDIDTGLADGSQLFKLEQDT